MCVIEAPWHIVEMNHQVTVHDEDGDFVVTAKNTAVAKHVVAVHTQWLTTNTPVPGGLVELLLSKGKKNNEPGESESR